MAKVRTSYVCRDCGNVQPKWMGKCPDCGAWDALERFTERDAAEGPAPGALAASPLIAQCIVLGDSRPYCVALVLPRAMPLWARQGVAICPGSCR